MAATNPEFSLVDLDDSHAMAVRLEREGLIVLPGQPFTLEPAEIDLVSPRFSDGRAKNISLAPDGEVRGATADADARRRLATVMERYRDWAVATVSSLAPRYAHRLERG